MIRALFLAILLASSVSYADFGVAGGGVRRIYAYGDSYCNSEEYWVAYLQYHGIERTQIWNACQGGARAYYYPATDSNCDSGNGYTACEGYIQYQVLPLDGSCRVDYTDTAGVTDGGVGSTCIQDLDIAPNDICLLFVGTNDVGKGAPSAWDGTFRPLYETSVDLILDEFDRVGCPTVVSSSVPLIRGQVGGGDGNASWWRNDGVLDRDDNAVLASRWLREEIETNRPNMVYVDVRQAFDQYATDHGEALFLSLYECEGGRGSEYPTLCADGIHPHDVANSLGDSGTSIQGGMLGRAILQLRNRIRNAPVWIGN